MTRSYCDFCNNQLASGLSFYISRGLTSSIADVRPLQFDLCERCDITVHRFLEELRMHAGGGEIAEAVNRNAKQRHDKEMVERFGTSLNPC